MSPPQISVPGVEVLEELGRGAHSAVFRARRAGRYYALKVPEWDGRPAPPGDAARRFLREAVALARVRHPALPAVMEVGQSGELPYIVMELAAGETLAERLRQGPLDEDQVIELSIQLADALSKIHETGLLHRDVKPSNILFDSHTTAVRLVDFGLASAAGVQTDPEKTAESASGPLSRHAGEARGDLFALGCVLFECLTGSAPFSAVDPEPLLERHAESPSLPPLISRSFVDVLRRLLAIGGASLYPDAQALLDDLRCLRDPGSHISLRPSERLSRFSRASPVAFLGRERELDRLRAAFRASVGRGQVVLVRGARGAGKSRLLHAFLEELEAERRTWFAVRCEQLPRGPFAVVRELIEAQLAEYDSLPPARRLAAIAQFRERAGDAAALLRALSPRLSRVFADAPQQPRTDGVEHVFAESLAELLGRLLNESAPVAVVIDDLQWLDAGSRRVIARLVDRASSRVLFLLAARDDAENWAASERLLRTLEPERVWELSLEPFDEQRTLELARAYLRQDRLDPELVRYLVGLGDGTPLGVIETVRSLLEGGVLVPYWNEWKFDRDAAARIALPRGSLELVARRVDALDPSCTAVLTVGAVIGTTFAENLLCSTLGQSVAEARSLIADARRAMLVESVDDGYRFVHDAVREAVLERVSGAELRGLHQRVAEALDEALTGAEQASGEPSSELEVRDLVPELELGLELAEERELARRERVIACATHYLSGEREAKVERVLLACRAAAELTFHAFDNELSLRFFEGARDAAQRLGKPLDRGFEMLHAEALLRTGAIELGVARLRAIVERAPDDVARAQALHRVAWAEMQRDTERAWSALGEAFHALHAVAPSDSLLGLLSTALSWMKRLFLRKRAAPADRPRLETLAALYWLAGRLAFHSNKPIRLVHATLRGLLPAEQLGSPSALGRIYSHYSFVLTALGFRAAGERWQAVAERVAKSTRNPVDYAQVLQGRMVARGMAGNLRAALEIGERLLTEYGHWRELSEYCAIAYSQFFVESLRGRNLVAWSWLERAVVRLERSEVPVPRVNFIDGAVRAGLLVLGRHQEHELLLSRTREARNQGVAGAEMFNAYGSRVRLFTECADLGPEFEALVAEFGAAGLNPKRIPPEVTEYYLHVAHARAHACLHAEPAELPQRVARLRAAARDLRRTAMMDLLRAHATVVEGYLQFFEGRLAKAERSLARAEALALQEGSPWVLYAVHRCRAHMARAAGNLDAARDQARVAEALAREHGAAYRLRWIRQEFGLRVHDHGAHGLVDSSSSSSLSSVRTPDSDTSPSRSRPRGYLRTLVKLGERTARELGLAEQVRLVLDELLEVMHADRGFLFLSRARVLEERDSLPSKEEGGELDSDSGFPSSVRERLALLAARGGNGKELVNARGYDPRLIEELFEFGSVDGAPDDVGLGRLSTLATYGDRALIATALSVRGGRVGVLYLDRPLRMGGFSELDARVLAALSAQVPLVFELARSLRERDRIEETQRSAEKLEAIGRLAGGIAHDFNNMLSVILAASEQVLTQRSTRTVVEDVHTIQTAAERARDLTRQLLAFSRGQYLNPEVLQLNELIARLEPLFRRVLGENIALALDLEHSLCRVKADPAQIDQVLTNLVVNAADAMRGGGCLRIETTNRIVLRSDEAAPRALDPGRYACIVVEDTGDGMDEATLGRVFEPFFTTKEGGSGLGLATAYGIIAQSGGHIELVSELGRGTTFRIFLPETVQKTSILPQPERHDVIPRGNETVLLVDDEPLVRESTRRMLVSLGYSVVSAKNSEEALSVAGERLDGIDLVISDVIMPGMNGLELARELSRLRPSVKVLFVSGYTAGVLAERGVLKESVAFLQKPIALETLAPRLRSLLDERR